MNYKVFAATRDDINSGWIWVGKPQVAQRTVVRVLNHVNGKSFYSEALSFDKNYLNAYNGHPRHSIDDPHNAIVLNEWYRNRLGGLSTQNEYDLQVAPAEHLYGRLRSCTDHPQVVVRIATWLGLWSFVLGLAALALGVASVCSS